MGRSPWPAVQRLSGAGGGGAAAAGAGAPGAGAARGCPPGAALPGAGRGCPEVRLGAAPGAFSPSPPEWALEAGEGQVEAVLQLFPLPLPAGSLSSMKWLRETARSR